MLNVDDIRSIPLFAALADADLDRLAQTSADLHLKAGEYAVHEGAERALYAVLAGKIEVVKMVDGIERTLGYRAPGAIFGEVPLTFGTVFPGAYRAAEPSRVLRVDPKDYYAVAASSPAISAKIGALALERIGGLKGIAAEPPKVRATLFGDRWDPACSALRHFLARNQISFEWITPDASDVSARWPGTCPTSGDCPALKLGDGTLLTRNSRHRRAHRPANPAATGGIRHDDHRRRPGRPRSGGLRRVRRVEHDRRGTRGAGRPGGNVVTHRELPRLSQRRFGRRARESRAAASEAPRR